MGAFDVGRSIAAGSARRRSWSVFAIMSALMVLNHLDRQIVASMFPFLKQRWALTDAELGALVSVVAVTVAVGTIPLSFLADRWGQVKSIFLMALIWSGATLLCAFTTRYGELLAARALIGAGEAAYGSVGCALLASLFPERIRSAVLGSFLIAALIGSVVGVMVGGVAIQHWGWQAGFVVAGVPGVVLAALFLMAAGTSDRSPTPVHPGRTERFWRHAGVVLGELVRARSAPLACIGAGLQLVSVSAMYAWLPTLLNRGYGFAPAQAGVAAGFIVLAGVPGAIAFGVLADRMARRLPASRYYLATAAALLTALSIAAALGSASAGVARLAWLVLTAASMPGIVGPVTAAIVEVVPAHARATAAGVLAATQNLFGLALGPVLIGILSDRHDLEAALNVVPVFCSAAALFFAAAARAYPRDRARVESIKPAGTFPLGA